MMKYYVIGREGIATSRWSGGTTTQLAIWPEGASYAARDFLWRVSTATVEDEESEFTPLPDYTRILMVLEGGVSLTHEGASESVELGRFGQTRFSGGVLTRSRGRARDFNLMMRSGKVADGYVEAMHVPAGERVAVVRRFDACVSEVFYIYLGDVEAVLPDGKAVTMREGDVLVVYYDSGDHGSVSFCNASSGEAEVIRAGIVLD